MRNRAHHTRTPALRLTQYCFPTAARKLARARGHGGPQRHPRGRQIREIRIRPRLRHCKYCPCDARRQPRSPVTVSSEILITPVSDYKYYPEEGTRTSSPRSACSRTAFDVMHASAITAANTTSIARGGSFQPVVRRGSNLSQDGNDVGRAWTVERAWGALSVQRRTS